VTTVIVPMGGDIIHPGHINIIKAARNLGRVTVLLASDEVLARHKHMPIMNYEQRKLIVENIKGIVRVVPLTTLDLVSSLRRLKPDYLVHGDDWQTGVLQEIRQRALEVLKEWDGELVEVPYTQGISSTKLRTVLKRVDGR